MEAETINVSFNTDNQSVFKNKHIKNISSDYITITEDKLTLTLKNHIEGVLQRRRWKFPATICISLFVAYVTTEFKSKFHIPAEILEGVFILSFIISTLFLAFYGFITFRLWFKKEGSIEKIIEEIKNQKQY